MTIEFDDELFKHQIIEEARKYVNARCFSIVEQALKKEVVNQLNCDLSDLIRRSVAEYMREESEKEFDNIIDYKVIDAVKRIFKEALDGGEGNTL